jgi:hypothetical protein
MSHRRRNFGRAILLVVLERRSILSRLRLGDRSTDRFRTLAEKRDVGRVGEHAVALESGELLDDALLFIRSSAPATVG